MILLIAGVLLGLVLAYYTPIGLPSHRKQIKYRKGIKYQLTESHSDLTNIHPPADIETDWITLTMDGVITIRADYCWDGPSGPTWDTKDFMRASLVHDAFYQLMRMKLLGENDLERESFRNAADIEMSRIQKEDCMNPVRRYITHLGVLVGAGPAADPANRRKVHTAPLHV